MNYENILKSHYLVEASEIGLDSHYTMPPKEIMHLFSFIALK